MEAQTIITEKKERKQQDPSTRKPQDISKRKIAKIKNAPNDIVQAYADRLKLFRRMLKVSLRQMESETGIPQSTINKYENGGLNISVAYVGYLVIKYNLNSKWLFTGKGRRDDEKVEGRTLLKDLASVSSVVSILQDKQEAMQQILFDLIAENKKLWNIVNELTVKLR